MGHPFATICLEHAAPAQRPHPASTGDNLAHQAEAKCLSLPRSQPQTVSSIPDTLNRGPPGRPNRIRCGSSWPSTSATPIVLLAIVGARAERAPTGRASHDRGSDELARRTAFSTSPPFEGICPGDGSQSTSRVRIRCPVHPCQVAGDVGSCGNPIRLQDAGQGPISRRRRWRSASNRAGSRWRDRAAPPPAGGRPRPRPAPRRIGASPPRPLSRAAPLPA